MASRVDELSPTTVDCESYSLVGGYKQRDKVESAALSAVKTLYDLRRLAARCSSLVYFSRCKLQQSNTAVAASNAHGQILPRLP